MTEEDSSWKSTGGMSFRGPKPPDNQKNQRKVARTIANVNNPVLAWHGTHLDGTTESLKIKEIIGIKTYLTGDIIICENALHGNICAVDTLRYARGLWLKRTLHEGTVVQNGNKIGSSERTVVAEANATQVVLGWAFWCANRAIRIHAVVALQRVGMDMEAEKLASLEAITNVKSAHDAADSANAIRHAAIAANNTIYILGHSARAARAAADAARSAAEAVVHVNTVYDISNMGFYAGGDGARAAAYASDYTVYASTSDVFSAAAETAEADFINAELESRLFALMSICKES